MQRPIDRRTRRSQRAHEALALHLEHVRGEARLEALVLATEEGLRVAHSGEERLCEELAARAPFLDERENASGKKRKTRVRAVNLLGDSLYLVSFSRDDPTRIDAWFEHTSLAITRILSA